MCIRDSKEPTAATSLRLELARANSRAASAERKLTQLEAMLQGQEDFVELRRELVAAASTERGLRAELQEASSKASHVQQHLRVRLEEALSVEELLKAELRAAVSTSVTTERSLQRGLESVTFDAELLEHRLMAELQGATTRADELQAALTSKEEVLASTRESLASAVASVRVATAREVSTTQELRETIDKQEDVISGLRRQLREEQEKQLVTSGVEATSTVCSALYSANEEIGALRETVLTLKRQLATRESVCQEPVSEGACFGKALALRRQVHAPIDTGTTWMGQQSLLPAGGTPHALSASKRAPVSYTHLTLPTKRIV
eukprot:TRINITY_DN40708_c0_g1_i1.p1 TRINITY_DN40708_c0_g1~~TRINITY_DN40708_c0_g1_i1.p1  ORF type:complete len:321 (-),score=90.08 TRINITY_DN40708_c0_g1_i1:121-1083(-)